MRASWTNVICFLTIKLFTFLWNFFRENCSSFKEYLDCSEHVTRRTCGIETGLFIREFLHKMSDTLMQNYCEEHYKGSNQCPNEFSTATKFQSSAFSLILVVFLATFTNHRISWKLMEKFCTTVEKRFEWFLLLNKFSLENFCGWNKIGKFSVQFHFNCTCSIYFVSEKRTSSRGKFPNGKQKCSQS